MRIVHIAPNAPFNDGWGYQENLLPKYQKKLGHDVTLIITNTMHKDGKIVETDCNDYVSTDGVRVIRLKRKSYFPHVLTNMFSHLPVFDILCEIKPDMIFFHGVCSRSILDAIQYKKKKNSDCVIVQDSHLDYYNGPNTNSFKGRLVRIYHRGVNRKTVKSVEKIYGVTPWRKTYLEDYFGIPSKKTDVLIMGADDEKIDLLHKEEIRKRIREQYDIADEEFLIVAGGKIDRTKNIHVLMRACAKLSRVKLLVFGNVADDLQEEFDEILKSSENIIFIGWLKADQVYNYFMASEMVCFPGTHSVMWEQACACKVPCLFKKWEGMEHVNNGGNSEFISQVSEENLFDAIQSLIFTDKYLKMRNIADSEKTDIYLYSRIAEKSVECIM